MIFVKCNPTALFSIDEVTIYEIWFRIFKKIYTAVFRVAWLDLNFVFINSIFIENKIQ